MSTAFGRFKASAFLVILAGYLFGNYPFMQLRIPPADSRVQMLAARP